MYIYTTNFKKYKNFKNDFIENVYTEKEEIIIFINEHKNNSDIFKSFKLINYEKYIDKYYDFHKIISKKYDENSLNDKDRFNSYLALLKDINSTNDLDVGSLTAILETLNNDTRREYIVREYTGDSIYKYLNKWQNELDFFYHTKKCLILFLY